MKVGLRTLPSTDPMPEPPPGGNPGAAGQFTLVRKIAKLVATTGEFVCIIRAISSTELRLQLLHPLPDAPRFALELPNGDCYFIEKQWESDREAGFRFSTQIEVGAFIFEACPFAKRPIRLRTVLPALISVKGTSGEAVIHDLSQEGARIEASLMPALYQRIRIDTEPVSAPIFATVHWKSQRHFGVLFERPFSLEELAAIAWSLHDPATSATGRARRFEVVHTTSDGA